MPNYRRNRSGSIFFFTLVTYQRRQLFVNAQARFLLSGAIDDTMKQRPWINEAMVLMPDHLHMLWRLPEGDLEYSTRIAAIKKRFTRAMLRTELSIPSPTAAQARHRRQAIWQERFWEHTIRNAEDFRYHLDYIHMNPVKHGLAKNPADWPYSTFGTYVSKGMYEANWCGRIDLPGQTQYEWLE